MVLGAKMSCMAPCIEVTSHWWQWHPPIGVFIGVLAVMGVLVPLFREWGEIGRLEKVLWTLAMFALLALELRTLYLDRDEHDAEQALARCRDLESFQAIANKLDGSIRQAQGQYQSTIAEVNNVLKTTQSAASLAKNSVDQLSGKGSYPCIVPQSHAVVDGKIPLVLHNRGKNNLTGVGVQILSPHAFTEDIREFYKPEIDLGTVNPIWSKPLPVGIAPELDRNGIADYTIFIWTQNGFYSEVLQFRKGKYLPFAYRYWLTKREVFDKPTKQFPKGAQVSTPITGCQSSEWSDDLGDGKPTAKMPG
jgi:hypothetical protein